MSSLEKEKGRKPTVPKFTSFKRAKSPSHPTHESTHESSRSDATPAPSRSAPAQGSSRPHMARGADHEQNNLFFIDKRGDPLIRRYGGNDPRLVPPYRRFGAGRILGADGFMRIERIGNHDEFYIATPHEGRSLLGGDKKTLLARGLRTSDPIQLRRDKSAADDATREYISFGSSSKKRKRGRHAEESSSGEEGPNYRSIYGKSKPHDYADSDEHSDSDGSHETDRIERDPATLRSIELSRTVREHPEDIDSWLDLVGHQDTLLQIQCGTRGPTAAETRSFADIKLSLLEQALSHTSDDSRRERLNLKVLQEGLKVWEFKTASKRFADILKKYPTSFEVWKLYTTFRQTSLSSFKFDEIKKLYTDKLRDLRKEYETLKSTPDQIECCGRLIYVFLRLTRFLADAGFVDLATALWQATLELTFSRPSAPQVDEWEIPSSFRDFWEAEGPRLGEDGWRGWASCANNNGIDDQLFPEPKLSTTAPTPSTRDGYRAWYTTETHRASDSSMPARTLDDGAEVDPFRVVLFADIQGSLLYFPTQIIPHIKRQILDAFLIFCELPPAFYTGLVAKEASEDPLLIQFSETKSSRKGQLDGTGSKQPEFSHSIHDMQPTADVFFPSRQWFTYIWGIRDKIPRDRYHWISTSLKLLSRNLDAKELGPYSLAFETTNDPGNEKKNAKTLLKRDPSNVDLYLGYAILENEKGDEATAENVLSAALSLPSLTAEDRMRLRTGAAWVQMGNGNLGKAAVRLCQLAEDKSQQSESGPVEEMSEASSSQILKARQSLSANRDYSISSGHIAFALIHAEALMLLEYLTGRDETEARSAKQGDISSAIRSISQCSEELASRGHDRSPAHERFLQSAARLLYYHATHGSLRPSLLREQLKKYLTHFPSNTVLLNLFAWREERLSVDDRVRSLLQDQLQPNPNNKSAPPPLSTHIFAIQHEQHVGTAHSTRAAFERALLSFAFNPSLWISYIRFCHSCKELRPGAKAVFYRAIQSCPWSRDVFLEAFATLVRDMDSGELKSVCSTMSQKGLRLFTDLEIFVEKWRMDKKRAGQR